ncbi:putative cholinesterase [Podospora fimiseda]|uniref:Cholinesterase n=1 Tax=Podospora fimiseda TaxID=252190 RepID=A0AAN7BZZ9_9PEZI|nr:putative cholinesterase [Podospora fimiseda]
MRFASAVVFLSSLVAGESLKKLNTGLTILVNNDLLGPNSPNADTSVILTDSPLSQADFEQVCSSLGEQPYSPNKSTNTKALQPLLNYIKHEDHATPSTQFWISQQKAINTSGHITSPKPKKTTLQGLCTNTSPFSTPSFSDTSSKNQISLQVNNQTLTGFRDRLSFRFLGLRYAPQPQRFTYSTLFQGNGEQASALNYGSQCAQGTDTGSEDCLFLNVWTPYLPNPVSNKKKSLRPVAFWIHGGAFTGGTANDATFDGGNMASRGDIVVVAINYRLSTLGFLALKDGITNGNYGLADQIIALDWVKQNIASLGGDPDRVTIFGQSAGAASVRALIASPKAKNKFSGAILLSNLGGLGYGTTYSKYYTIDEQFSVAASQILSATNCTDVDCLRSVPAHTLTQLGGARYLVVDGTYLTSSSLPTSSGPPLNMNLMMGITRDDGAPFISFPTAPNISQIEYLASQGFSSPPIPLDLYPVTPSNNRSLSLFTSSAKLATDAIFRCVDQATAYSLLENNRVKEIYYYEFDRTYQTGGWPGLDVCEPPRSEKFPKGDLTKEYLNCHSGELYYVFGTLTRQGLTDRDGHDISFGGYILDSFLGFIRTGNPDLLGKNNNEWVKVRGYEKSLELAGKKKWESSKKGKLGVRIFDWPESKMTGFRSLKECDKLGLGLESYYG